MEFKLEIPKRELTFWAAGILMLLIVVIGTFFAIRFLVVSVDRAVSEKGAVPGAMLEFQVEKAEEILK